MRKNVTVRIPFLCMLIIAVSAMPGCESNKSRELPRNSQDSGKKESPRASNNNQPLPRAAFSAMLEKVDRGDWTLEEGLITHLRILAGEMKAGAVYGDHVFTSGQADDFLILAQHYAHKGKDPKAREEVRRLLDILFPDIERLKKYSIPEKAVSGRMKHAPDSRRYAGLLDWIIPNAYAYSPEECLGAWEAGFPAEGVPAEPCFKHREFNHSGRTHIIFYPAAWQGTPNHKYVGLTEKAIKRSLRIYRGIASMTNKNIHTVFSIVSQDNVAVARPRLDNVTDTPAECRIIVYNTAHAGVSDNVFRQTIAHEVFHCFQYWNLWPQFGGSLRFDIEEIARLMRAKRWWSEGSAEYFSNVVYPCANSEWSRIDALDVHSVSSSLMEMDYENFLFFQYLGNVLNNDRIIGLLRRMPTRGGSDEQAAALAGYPNMATIFHDFGRAYLDRDIKDTCRRRKVPVTPRIEDNVRVVFHGSENRLPAKRFHLSRWKLEFMGGRYEMKYSPDREPPNSAVKVLPGVSWEPPPERIDVGCLDRDYMLLVTYAVGDPRENEYVLRELSDAYIREMKVDPCLVGEWKAEPGSAESIGQWVAEKRSGSQGSKTVSTEFLGVTGDIYGRVTNGGRAEGWISNLEQRYGVLSDDRGITNIDSRFDIRVIVNGNSCADYSADGRVLLVWNISGEEKARAIVTGNIGGKSYHSDQEINLNKLGDSFQRYFDSLPSSRRERIKGRINLSAEGRLPSEIKFGYRCRGNTLEIDPPAGSGSDDRPPWKFRRRS